MGTQTTSGLIVPWVETRKKGSIKVAPKIIHDDNTGKNQIFFSFTRISGGLWSVAGAIYKS